MFDNDVMAGEQAEKAKDMDRANQKEAAEQLAKGIALPEHDLVEHIYVPDPDTNLDLAAQT